MNAKTILSELSTENLLLLRRELELILKTRNQTGHKIADLELSTRSKNVLLNCEFTFIEDLAEYTEYDFLRFRNIGRKSFIEIKKIMAEHNTFFSERKDFVSIPYKNRK